MSQGDPTELIKAAGGFIGNSYRGSALTDTQSLETLELQVRQNARQTAWLFQKYRPQLMLGYLPAADELGHRYLGLAAQGDAEAKRWLEWGFTAVEIWSQQIARLIKRSDHLVITADHGMAPTHRMVNVNEILRRASLGDVAVHVYNSVLLNDKSWEGGAVDDRVTLREQVRAALAAVRNPDPVFTGFYTPEEHRAQYGIGGDAASDLYFDLAPGYSVEDQPGAVFPPLARPRGNHGFRPDRDDMLATLFAVGPKVKPGARWGRMRSIDVSVVVSHLLGIHPPPRAAGRLPMAGFR